MIRYTDKTKRLCATVAVAALLISVPVVLHAQDAPGPNQALKDEQERVETLAAIAKARGELARARVSALGLPSFNGTTEVGENGGAIEATLLSTHAVDAAAATIVERLNRELGPERKILLLSSEETIDFSLVSSAVAQMDAIHNQLERAITPPSAEASPTIIAAVTAAAGLLRSDSTLSGIALPGISDRMLTLTVASRLGGRAIFPTALTASLPACPDNPPSPPPAGSCIEMGIVGVRWERMNVAQKFNYLAERRSRAQRILAGIPETNPTNAQKTQKAMLEAAIARYDSFYTAMTAAGENGQVPIAQAVRLERLLADNPAVVRVYLDRAGGSMLKQTNLLTFFGADPLRISGAMVASYVVTEPTSGSVTRAAVISCRTALTSVRSVQDWNWRPTRADTGPRSRCDVFAGTQ